MSLFAVLRNRKDCRHEIESVLHRNYYPKPGHGSAVSSISLAPLKKGGQEVTQSPPF